MPFVCYGFVLRVRCVNQHIIFGIGLASLYLGYLFADGEQCVDETVNLRQRFALRGLYHQRAVHRERERGRMVAEVHQTLCDVALGDTDSVELAAIENQLVPYPALHAGIDHAVGVAQLRRHIVGAQDSRCRSMTQCVCSHHSDVRVTD